MSGFGSLNTALSALRYTRVAMDVASENIANFGTEGFTRRQVDSASVGAGAVPAMWFRDTGIGDGVGITGVSRVTDELLNVRGRREHASQGFLDVQASALRRIENGLAEPGDDGLSGALRRFRTSWDDLGNSPTGAAGSAARAAVLSASSAVVDAVRSQVHHLEGEASDQRVRVLYGVAEANDVALDLARTNVAIVSGALNGSDVNALRDTRDQLAGRLAELAGGVTVIGADGAATVTVGSVALVQGAQAGSLAIASGITVTGEPDGTALTYSVSPPAGAATTVAAGGELGGVARLLDHHIAGHLAQLAEVVAGIADTVNAQHASGYDATGTAGGPVFDVDPADVLGSFSLAITDGARLAASAVPGGGSDGGNADAIFDLTSLGEGYQRLVTSFGSTVVEATRQVSNQRVLTDQIDSAREQLGGVDLDEEMVNLTVLQRHYEAAARVMTTVDAMLDTLINRTGVLR